MSRNRLNLGEFKKMVETERQAAFNIYPFKHYFGMISVEIVPTVNDKEGGYKIWTVPSGGGERSMETFYPFSREKDFEHDILQKLHPQHICSCSNANECFSKECPVKPQ